MNAFYFSNSLCVGPCHTRARWVINEPAGLWYIAGTGTFTKSGFACIDDFGNLVEVAA
jgi:hypothetical protein